MELNLMVSKCNLALPIHDIKDLFILLCKDKIANFIFTSFQVILFHGVQMYQHDEARSLDQITHAKGTCISCIW